MARRRSKKTTHRRRSRRVGALALNPSSPLVKYGTIAAGFLLAKIVNTSLNGLIPASLKAKTGSPKIVAGAQAGLGALLIFSKGKKSTVKSIAGGLLLGSGIKRLLDSMAAGAPTTITGYGNVDVISGYGNVNVISGRKMNGYTPNNSLNGYTPNMNLSGQRPLHNQVMGSADTRNGSGYMQ